MKLEFKELEIELELDGLIQLEAFRLTQGLNSHGAIFVKFLIEEETAESFVNLATVFPVTVRETACTGGRVIFKGKAERIYTKLEAGQTYLYLEAYSYSKEWERVEKSRSFLNGSMTYMEVAQKVVAGYDRADIKDEITEAALIPDMLVQYEESDWVFLRRLASHFGTYLMADCSDDCGRAYFGIPHINNGTEITSQEYTLEKDMFHYARVLKPEGVLPQEASKWRIKTRRFLSMGEDVRINQVEAIVTEVDLVLEKGELVCRYTLSRREGISREKEKNPRIYGMSIPATVKDRSGNRIQVQFDIDEEYDPVGKFFTYAIESSSFYCMPEVGSRVHIYFPEHDEQSAIAVHAIGSGSGGGQNPDNKRFSDPSGSAMDMTPDSLSYAPDSSGATLLYMGSGGEVSIKGLDISIKTQKGLMAGGEKPTKNVMLSGGNKVTLQVGDGGEDSIILESDVDTKSALILHTAESSPEAQPSADQLLSQVGADDEKNRADINAAVTSTLVQNKKASKQKIMNGLISIATVVGAVALTVASGGAAAPLLLVAVPKLAFAAADIAEGIDGHNKVNAMDTSRPANFIRDNLMGGNQALYDFSSMAADIVFDVVAGKGIKNASKLKGPLKFLCKGSQKANMAFQVGGSVVFGAINEYMVTGSVNIKELGVYTVAGVVKGFLGNRLTAKALGAMKTESKLLKKGAGFVINTLTGVGVDFEANHLLKKDTNIKQLFTQNAIASFLGQLFGEPIDAVSGAFLITAADFTLPGISGPLKVTRKYSSAVKEEGILGQGWRFLYEGRLFQDGIKIHADLDTGYHVLFEWKDDTARNITPGCTWYELEKDGEEWLIRDRKEHRTYRYGITGLLLSITDQNGQALRLEYQRERLERIITPLGQELSLTMREGRLVQMADGLGRTMQYRYENGRLSDVVHMDQGITHYEYDQHGYLTKAVDQAKVTYLENQYDDAGRITLQTLANGDTYEAEYLDAERQVRVRSSIGDKTVLYRYNKAYQIVSMEYGDGTSTLREYSEDGYRIRETNRLGGDTAWDYDGLGRMVREQSPGGLLTEFTYDDADDLSRRQDNAGRLILYAYDGRHNLVKVQEKAEANGPLTALSYQYDRKGRLTGETDARGVQTEYVYEEGQGKPSAVRYGDGEETRYEHDPWGRTMAEEDGCGRTEYGYNARNFRTMVRDGEGNETRYMYDGMGRLLAMYPPKAWKERKGEYAYKYDFLDRLIDTRRPDGSHERQMRDGEGNIIKKVHSNAYDELADDGEGIRYDYDGEGNNIRIHYPDGGCERLFYDGEGNRIKHVLPEYYDPEKDDGEGTSYEYDPAGRLAKITGPDGMMEEEYGYDLDGNMVSRSDALSRTSHYGYNLQGKLLWELAPAAEEEGELLYQKTTYAYDGNGNRTRERRHGGYWNREGILVCEDGTDLCLAFHYDSRNRLIRVEDGLGAVIQYQYDVRGNRVYEEKTISADVKQAIRYAYDRAGHLVERREELDSGLEPAAGEPRSAVTTYGYDENGNRILTQTPEGNRITREYDALDRLVMERVEDKRGGIDRCVKVSYDKAGNITRMVRQGKNGKPWEIRYDYDLKDRVTHANDCLGPVFRYEYDKNDRLLKEALSGAELDRFHTYSYDFRGNMVEEEDSAGTLREKHSYRADGKLAESRFADGNEFVYSYGANGLEQEIHTVRSRQENRAAQEYTYDARGRITGVKDGNQNRTNYRTDAWGRVYQIDTAEDGEEKYTYDYAGHVTSTTDANGGVITYRYNSQGKVCEITDQEGSSETFRYDREGRITLHVDRNGNQVRITYNVDGNPVLERACDRTGANEVIRSWEYEDIGNVKKAVAGGFCYTYEYRPDGKLVRKSSSGRTLVSCTYHADRSLESLTDVSGRTVFYSYDNLGRLERICDEEGTEIARYSHTPGGKLKDIRHGNGMQTVYEYDTDGNVIRLRLENQEGAVFSDFRYEYDLNGNRTLKLGSCLLPGEDSLKEQAVRYRYDSMNRLVEEQYNDMPIRYVYDQCGNRLEKIDNLGKEVYNYNCKNQLTIRKNNVETIDYRYDLQGNVLEEASLLGKTEYRYNALNQQTAVFMKDGGIQENQYDAEYLRAEVSENGRRSRFLYYNGELLVESEPDETVTGRYIPGYGVAAGWQNGNEGYHSYHLDEQNSTAYITDAGQGIENSYLYDAFGAIRGRQEGIHNRILYTGQQHDQVTGQYYLRARYYNPVVGRFLQEDVYRGDGLNLYAYCANNPVVYYDPSGYSYLPEAILKNMQRGNDFNKDYRPQYPYNEVRVTSNGKEYRVDSYRPSGYDADGNYQRGEIVSRKYTQFDNVKEETAIKYLNEAKQKYSPGTEIIDGNFNSREIRGTTLSEDAELVLQVQSQRKTPENVKKKADELGIRIEEVPDTVGKREKKQQEGNVEGCKEDS